MANGALNTQEDHSSLCPVIEHAFLLFREEMGRVNPSYPFQKPSFFPWAGAIDSSYECTDLV